MIERTHGGPDSLGDIQYDFSTNTNGCGPCPISLEAVRRVDPSRYPDPAYHVLKQLLGILHEVDPARIVIAASASEFVYRMTAVAAMKPKALVWAIEQSFGDYLAAADAWSLKRAGRIEDASLAWIGEPSSPLGLATFDAEKNHASTKSTTVIDLAYEPLRLDREFVFNGSRYGRAWQLWTPNKALGLTGVRGAYAIAPAGAADVVATLESIAPSWPVGAHGVAMLTSWTLDSVQAWLATSRLQLAEWKARQEQMLGGAGWFCLPSDTNFFCADPRLDAVELGITLEALRTGGIKLRDATSFGLPGLVRVSVQSPRKQDILVEAITAIAKARAALREGKSIATAAAKTRTKAPVKGTKVSFK